MSIKQVVISDMKLAMKARDSKNLSAIRLLLSAIKQKEIDERIELSDKQIIAIVQKMIKQRRDSIVQFKKASRTDLVTKEANEIAVIERYMPQQMPKDKIQAVVQEAIRETKAHSLKDMGKLMRILKEKLPPQTDMALVSQFVKDKLS